MKNANVISISERFGEFETEMREELSRAADKKYAVAPPASRTAVEMCDEMLEVVLAEVFREEQRNRDVPKTLTKPMSEAQSAGLEAAFYALLWMLRATGEKRAQLTAHYLEKLQREAGSTAVAAA